MTKINIDSSEVLKIDKKLKAIAQTLAQVSSNNYITTSVFHESQGQSVDCLDALLYDVVQCTNQMESLFLKTCEYLSNVIEQFEYVENDYKNIFNKTSIQTEK